MSSWRWAVRALGVGATLIVAGWLIGGGIGLWSGTAAMAISGTLLVLVGAPWAVFRLGGAGLAAGALGILAAIGASIEGHRAWVVTHVPIVDSPTPEFWPRGVNAIRVPRVLHQTALRATASWSTRGSKGSSTHYYRAAVPLALSADGPIVAFDCHDGYGRPDADGTYLLDLATWEGNTYDTCSRPVAATRDKIRQAGRRIALGAEQRTVRVFSSEAELRAAHKLRSAFELPLVFFFIYAMCVLLFQRAGLRSLQKT